MHIGIETSLHLFVVAISFSIVFYRISTARNVGNAARETTTPLNPARNLHNRSGAFAANSICSGVREIRHLHQELNDSTDLNILNGIPSASKAWDSPAISCLFACEGPAWGFHCCASGGIRIRSRWLMRYATWAKGHGLRISQRPSLDPRIS